MAPAPLSAGLQSLPLLPTIKLGPSGAGSQVGGLVHTLGPCGSLQQPLLWGWEFLLLPPQPPQAFSIRGLRLYFPMLEPWVTRSALLPAVRPGYLCANVGLRGATRRSVCSVLRHSESGPLGLSVCDVGPQGLLVVRLPAPFVSHSASRGPTTATRVLSAPAARLRPSYRSGWNVYFLSPWCRTSLPLDFLSILVVRGGAVCLPTPPSWFSYFWLLLISITLWRFQHTYIRTLSFWLNNIPLYVYTTIQNQLLMPQSWGKKYKNNWQSSHIKQNKQKNGNRRKQCNSESTLKVIKNPQLLHISWEL